MAEAIGEDSDLRNIPARWRALMRLAIQGHDTERELEFHARELRSQRFAEHWPLPWLNLRSTSPKGGSANNSGADVWKSVLGFWFGVFYEAFSNSGRSLIRPAAFWLAAIVLGAVCYVSQSTAMVDARAKERAAGSSAIAATLRTAADAWLVKRVPCYAGQAVPPKDKNGNTPLYVGALSGELQSGTDIANEAWHLAFRNAFIVLDGSGEAAHRSYGCLYGVEMYGGSDADGRCAQRRLHHQRGAEAVLRADDFPVRPGAAQYAEDEVIPIAGIIRARLCPALRGSPLILFFSPWKKGPLNQPQRIFWRPLSLSISACGYGQF